ncbi:GNAT family N-acetyltransferase [Consotaella aegiceratis]|uniref:GNAT family N-acetyltransferase n=1 Tax=Consotaella aegiceratis TaxID=3097961 RepID=UPI002F3ED389
MDNLIVRLATPDDLDALIALFADDQLGGHGDSADPALRPAYLAAFERIAASPSQHLYVAELEGAVVGTFELTLSTDLVERGATKAILEAVQVRSDLRGRRIGEAMVHFAMNEARRYGAVGMKLTSNAKRVDAHRFYERLGFAKSHAGFTIKL